MNTPWDHVDEDRLDLDFTREPAIVEWLQRWFWPLAGLTAWILFKLTSELWASTLVLCAHFAWKPVATGVWLARRDPWRARGWCSLAAYLGHGVGRMSIAGLVVGSFLGPLADKQQAVQEAVLAAVLVPVIGMFVMVFLLWPTLLIARGKGVRLWVNSEVYRNHAQQWPPRQTGASNGLVIDFWISSLLGVPLLAGMIILPLFILGNNPNFAALVYLGGVVCSFLSVPIYHWFVSDVFARFPGDCWHRTPQEELAWGEYAQSFAEPDRPWES